MVERFSDIKKLNAPEPFLFRSHFGSSFFRPCMARAGPPVASMPQPRRSARLASQRARAAEQWSVPVPTPVDDVPVVDVTNGDDILCSVCGFVDGILEQLSCCGGPVHPECDGFCPDATPRSLRTMSLRSARCDGQS